MRKKLLQIMDDLQIEFISITGITLKKNKLMVLMYYNKDSILTTAAVNTPSNLSQRSLNNFYKQLCKKIADDTHHIYFDTVQ